MTPEQRASLCAVCHPGAIGQVCAKCLDTAPMRRVNEATCVECEHQWIAPKIGNCPKCHSPQTRVEVTRTNGLKRL